MGVIAIEGREGMTLLTLILSAATEVLLAADAKVEGALVRWGDAPFIALSGCLVLLSVTIIAFPSLSDSHSDHNSSSASSSLLLRV
jgi:hypothetical protein